MRCDAMRQADNTVCPGVPVGSGMILTNGSILLSRDANDFSQPFDTQCRNLCDANAECAIAHAVVETFSTHNAAHNLPPPPNPPTPPNPPPPIVPPLPPFPPTTPPLETLGPRVWSPGYNQAPESSEGLFHLYCGFSTGCNGFRTSVFASASQLAVLEVARKMQAQGTYAASLCPYECNRLLTRHSVSTTNANNLLSGSGLDGEGFLYPGLGDDTRNGFGRFLQANPRSDPSLLLHVLHMSRNVSMDECDAIVHRHKLLGPHAVWMVLEETQSQTASSARLGECGIFLGARSNIDAQLWRAFYDYARLTMRLGHFDSFVDSDIKSARIHSSSEGACDASTSTVCLWWSEFNLDTEEYSCRPGTDAANIVTPAQLLADLTSNGVAYPPPAPPPPDPPSTPPTPSPPPGHVRCDLSAIATTKNRKVYEPDSRGGIALVNQKCWRWDIKNNWPPFVAHRDLYSKVARCSDARSRDIQWTGGFKQSLMPPGTYDPDEQNNDDCPYDDLLYYNNVLTVESKAVLEDGQFCMDGSAVTPKYPSVCDLGTNKRGCGIHSNLVVFGYASLSYRPSRLWTRNLVGPLGDENTPFCVDKNFSIVESTDLCCDGGPGTSSACTVDCFYGTSPIRCGKRRFAFLPNHAGPDVPDDSCTAVDANGVPYTHNGHCDDGLMWSRWPPGQNPCFPNSDASDCGWRMGKRMARVGLAASDTCKLDCTESAILSGGGSGRCGSACSDLTDDALSSTPVHLKARMHTMQTCGRGTQTRQCERAATREMDSYVNQSYSHVAGVTNAASQVDSATEGFFAYNNFRFRNRTIYVNQGTIGQTKCISPTNVMRKEHLFGNARVHASLPSWALVYPDWDDIDPVTNLVQWKPWFSSGSSTSTILQEWPKHICSDGGEGSVRIPLRALPNMGSTTSTQYGIEPVTFDFACPYGSQNFESGGPCPARDLTVFQTLQDELKQPSGPEFQSCFDSDVADFEQAFRYKHLDSFRLL